MKVFFSKPLTFPPGCCQTHLTFDFHQVVDERALLADWGQKTKLIRADTLVCLNLFSKIILNLWKFDIFVTGRYGDIFAIFQGTFRIFQKPLILLDTEWPNKRKGGLIQRLSIFVHRLLARGSMKIQVFCKSEIEEYSQYYGIERNKFVWIPFCTEEFAHDWTLFNEEEYIFTGGLQHRDWETLYCAVKDLPILVYVVAPVAAVDKRYIAPNMRMLGQLHRKEYFRLMANSKLVVLSLEPGIMRSPGVITYVYAMRMGKCIIVNDPVGASSYITNNETGVIIEPKNPERLKGAILELLNDDTRRKRIGNAARDYGLSNFSGERYISDLVSLIYEVARAG